MKKLLGVLALLGLIVLAVACQDRPRAAPAPIAPVAPVAAPIQKVMPNLVGLTFDQALDRLVGVYPSSHPRTVPTYNDPDSTVTSQTPKAGAALEPEDGPVVLHMSSGHELSSTTPTTTTPSSSGVDVHVHRDHSLPDGALTGGYCRHKWWC